MVRKSSTILERNENCSDFSPTQLAAKWKEPVSSPLQCVFRRDLGTRSGATWAPIPVALGHSFRNTWAPIPAHLGTRSGHLGAGLS